MRAAVVGIDLGTTNSAVAAVRGGAAVVLADPRRGGGAVVPSVVALTEVRGRVGGWRGGGCRWGVQQPVGGAAASVGGGESHVRTLASLRPPTRRAHKTSTLVGEEALAAGDPENTFYSFKRLMGRK